MSIWFFAALLWTLGIFVALLMPGTDVQQVEFWGSDKIVHFAIFAGFAMLWMRALRGLVRRRAVWIVAVGVAIAVATELAQGVLPGRSPDLYDALADIGGLVLGTLAYVVWRRRQAVRT